MSQFSLDLCLVTNFDLNPSAASESCSMHLSHRIYILIPNFDQKILFCKNKGLKITVNERIR